MDICFAIPFTMLVDAVLSVSTGVGGCEQPISGRAVRMDFDFWHFSNNPPNCPSEADAMTFLMILHSTCTGPFPGVLMLLVCWSLGRGKIST